MDKSKTDPMYKSKTDPMDKSKTDPMDKSNTDPMNKSKTDPMDKSKTDPMDKFIFENNLININDKNSLSIISYFLNMMLKHYKNSNKYYENNLDIYKI